MNLASTMLIITIAWNASVTPNILYVLSVGTNSGQENISFPPTPYCVIDFVALQDPLPTFYYFTVESYDPVTGLYSVPSDEVSYSPVDLSDVFPTMAGFLPSAITTPLPTSTITFDSQTFSNLNHASLP